METNFEQLLNNTNLTPIEILKYYEEEIAHQFLLYYRIYSDSNFKNNAYEKYINKTELKMRKKVIINLIKEFMMLAEYIFNNYYKEIPRLNDVEFRIYNLENQLKNANEDLLREMLAVKTSINYIIKKLDEFSYCINLKNIISEKQEKEDIEKFYIAELNRLLDEKEARIYELEDEEAKNEQEIDGLINENVCLRRIIELNSDDDGTY